MTVDSINIKSSLSDYTVFFDNDLSQLKDLVNDLNTVFIVDQKVWNLYSGLLSVIENDRLVLVDALEENKEYLAISKILPRLTEISAKKNLTLVAIGGGIIQDITSFIASILYRGIRWIFIPTTLLAQADSCIGAKSSINFGSFKNLLGTFWAPKEVWLSTMFIDTLNTRDFYSGIGEIIKLFLIDGEDSLLLYRSLQCSSEADLRKNIIPLLKRALIIKKGYIEIDEFDRGVRNILNYGHCIGHAIESVSHYSIPHGQAVTLGMIWADIISEQLGLLSTAKRESIYNLYLKNCHSIKKEELQLNVHDIVEAMKKDKKREGVDLAIIITNDQGKFERKNDLKPQLVIDSYHKFVDSI